MIIMERALEVNPNEILSQNQEQSLTVQDMRVDAIYQMIRRLAKLNKQYLQHENNP